MNPISSSGLIHHDLTQVGNPIETAIHAIGSHNLIQLQTLLTLGWVNGNSQGPQGATLLMEATRHGNHAAFQLLDRDLQERQVPFDLEAQDVDGNTLAHYVALYLDDGIFAEPSSSEEWFDSIDTLLLQAGGFSGLDVINMNALTPVELAAQMNKPNMVVTMQAHEHEPDLEGEPDSEEEVIMGPTDDPSQSSGPSGGNPEGTLS